MTYRHHTVEGVSIDPSQCFGPPPPEIGEVVSAETIGPHTKLGCAVPTALVAGGLAALVGYGIMSALQSVVRDSVGRGVAYQYFEAYQPIGLAVIGLATLVGVVVGLLLSPRLRRHLNSNLVTTYLGTEGVASVSYGGARRCVRYDEVAFVKTSDQIGPRRRGIYRIRTYELRDSLGAPRFSVRTVFTMPRGSHDARTARPAGRFGWEIGQRVQALSPHRPELPAEWTQPYGAPPG